VLKLTLLTSAVASATFVGTLAFAPAIIDVGQRLGFGGAEIERVSAPRTQVTIDAECKTALQRVVAALKSRDCSP
jgi:hypothetical protein